MANRRVRNSNQLERWEVYPGDFGIPDMRSCGCMRGNKANCGWQFRLQTDAVLNRTAASGSLRWVRIDFGKNLDSCLADLHDAYVLGGAETFAEQLDNINASRAVDLINTSDNGIIRLNSLADHRSDIGVQTESKFASFNPGSSWLNHPIRFQCYISYIIINSHNHHLISLPTLNTCIR